jgi:hypothetical protein
MSSESSESPAIDNAAWKAGLKAKIKRWDKWGTRFAILVVVGLCMEYSLPWLSVQARYWLSGWITHWPYLHLMQVAHVFVAGGVAGELLAHRKQSNGSDDLTRLQENELEELKRETASANQRAAEAIERASKADLARAQLEERLSPRSFPIDKADEFALKLVPYANQRVDVMICDASPSTGMFAREICWALGTAQWKVRFWNLSDLLVAGINFELLHPQLVETKKASDALIAELASIGIGAFSRGFFLAESRMVGHVDRPPLEPGPDWDDKTCAPIRLYVGVKMDTVAAENHTKMRHKYLAAQTQAENRGVGPDSISGSQASPR